MGCQASCQISPSRAGTSKERPMRRNLVGRLRRSTKSEPRSVARRAGISAVLESARRSLRRISGRFVRSRRTIRGAATTHGRDFDIHAFGVIGSVAITGLGANPVTGIRAGRLRRSSQLVTPRDVVAMGANGNICDVWAANMYDCWITTACQESTRVPKHDKPWRLL